MGPPPDTRDLVLVGGGHAHVQVIRRWMMEPVTGVALTVVLDRAEALYSGMVPGFVAGQFSAHDCTIDLVPLVRRAGGTVVLSAATRIDPAQRQIGFEQRPPLRYDVASIDVGSTVRGLDRPGVRAHALATRPIGAFVAEVDARIRQLRETATDGPQGAPRPRVAIVGGGAAGFEIACTLHARLGDQARAFDWSLVAGDPEPLPGASRRMRRAARQVLDERGIAYEASGEVVAVREDAIVIRPEGGGPVRERATSLVVWATGGAALPVCTDSPLPHDANGFVRVDAQLRVVGCDALFAVGDCASFEPRRLPKAGVYAVRQGPVLDANLRAVLNDAPLRTYRPQRDFLALLNLGDGTALGGKLGLALRGRSVARLKSWIDLRFVKRFQVLSAGGQPSPDFTGGPPMDDREMPCGGCAAKVGAAPLEAALAALPDAPADDSVVFGLDRPDDAAAFRTHSGDVLLATVDGFRPFDGDAFLTGRVAAQNALSDLHAKGARPRHALALVTVEHASARRMQDQLHQVLAGIRHELDAAGVSLLGGHSTAGPELFVALSLFGAMPDGRVPWPNSALRPGDRLVLTKALGTGVVMAADMRGLARGAWRAAAVRSMLRPNHAAAEVAARHDVKAATDVSGFGLLGHLGEMLRASGVDAVIDPARMRALPGALALLGRGLRSSLHETNLAAMRFLPAHRAPTIEQLEYEPAHALLFDPQTSGGLLLGVAATDAKALLDDLHVAGDADARLVGRVHEGTGFAHLGPFDGAQRAERAEKPG